MHSSDIQPHEIRKLRNRHGLTVAQAAAMVRVTDRTWRRWEDGTRTMPPGALELFILKLGGMNRE